MIIAKRLALAACLAALWLTSIVSARAAEPCVEKIDLFVAGQEGYKLYRIPGIVVTKTGTVLAYCEARKSDSGDWGPIDVLLRRSTDGGRTWQPRQQLVHLEGDLPMNPVATAQNLDKPGENTVNNPVAIADHQTGAVHFLYCLEYMRCFHICSDDDGLTWTEPVEITAAFEAFRPEYDWKVLATGPAHGIQLTKGEHQGRLVVPVWLSLGSGGHAHRPSVTATIYSDDHGKIWQRGDIAVPDTPELIFPNESVVVQLSDGRVMLNSRSESKRHRRLVTVSPDGATDWSRPWVDDALLEPICMAGIVRVREREADRPGIIAFSNPHNLSRRDGKVSPGRGRDRTNVSIKLSYDEGQTWPAGRTLEESFSGYSDLAALPDGTILCFYERGSTDGNIYRTGRLTVARLNEEWVQVGNTSSGVLLDDGAAQLTGRWVTSSKQPPVYGTTYRHDNNLDRGQKSARFTPEIPATGDYEVRLIYVWHENRASNAAVTVHSADGEKTLRVNQRQPLLVDGAPRALGVFRFEAGKSGSVVISNEGADGYVVVDGIQFIPVEIARKERAGERESGFVEVPRTGEPEQVATRRKKMAAQVALSPLADKTVPATGDRKSRRSDEPVRLAADSSPEAVDGKSYDIVVVGGTGGGVACAVRAAREGCTVLLVQHNAHLGGMMTNGLMQWDALYGGPRAPLFTELLGNIENYYIATFGRDSKDHQTIRCTHEHYPISWAEPHVAEREFNRLIAAEKNITLLLDHYPTAVERNGALIKNVTLQGRTEAYDGKSIRVTATTFVDATYEGDLFALADVPYRVGREGRDEYGEPHAGKAFVNIDHSPPPGVVREGLNIRAYGAHQGTVDPASPFTADGAVQAYNYRFCVTSDPGNRIPIAKPAGYRREEYVDYERRYIASHNGPNFKSHVNSPILPGENHAYPEADWPTREKITQRHLDFGLGLMWFLQNDESISPERRKNFSVWGLPKDEYADNGHVPYEMYVREARRIVGRHVFTEHDGMLARKHARTPVHADSIAITDWYMDSHSCTLDASPGYKYDGKLILTEVSRPAQIPYRSLLPQGVDNLLVPVCLSATHIAWGSIRLEPVFMQTGEAAGFAAALAKQQRTSPAGLDSDLLVRTLVERRQLVSFFNDLKVTDPDPAIPAAQYFATKGFFGDYNARLDAPLSEAVAEAWLDGFSQLKEGRLAPAKLAAHIHRAESTNSPLTGRTRGEAILELWKRL